MAGSPSIAQISRASRAARKRFVAELLKLEPALAPFKARPNESRSAFVDGLQVVVEFKVIRASNGEVAGWPVASLMMGGIALSRWYSPPWLAGGCSPAAVIESLNHYRKGKG